MFGSRGYPLPASRPLAFALEKILFDKGYQTYVLDGDNVRHGLGADLGFSPEDRAENIRRVAETARLMAGFGVIVITAFISPYRADRDLARAVNGELFHEIHVRADIQACEARDPKGLYKKARAGRIKEFTGVTAPYEPPEAPEMVIDTTSVPVEESLEMLMDYVLENFTLSSTAQWKRLFHLKPLTLKKATNAFRASAIWDLNIRIERRLSRMNCRMFSTGFNAGDGAGDGIGVVSSGTLPGLERRESFLGVVGCMKTTTEGKVRWRSGTRRVIEPECRCQERGRQPITSHSPDRVPRAPVRMAVRRLAALPGVGGKAAGRSMTPAGAVPVQARAKALTGSKRRTFHISFRIRRLGAGSGRIVATREITLF